MRFLIRRLQNMTGGGIAGLLATVALMGVVAFVGVARVINTAPSQCASCHPALTAMWERSMGHPAEKVTCHECHGQHAELPDSPNVLAFARDSLIPEKYDSSDRRIEARCEGCHAGMREDGTGLQLILMKERLKQALNHLTETGAAEFALTVSLPPALAPTTPVDGRVLLARIVRELRNEEWLGAMAALVEPGDGDPTDTAPLREPLSFSAQALRWARVGPTKVQQGLAERTRVKLSQFKSGAGRVRRGVQALQQTMDRAATDTADQLTKVQQIQTQEVLESVSRGLRSASRARTALLRDLEDMGESILDLDRIARALKSVPNDLQKGAFDDVREALSLAAGLLEGPDLDETKILTAVEARAMELHGLLEAKLAEVKRSFDELLEDLPEGRLPDAAGALQLTGAELGPDPGLPPTPAGRRYTTGSEVPGPADLLAAASTAVKSLQVTLDAAAGIGWSDLSLRAADIELLLSRFDELAAILRDASSEGVDRTLVRRLSEQSLRALWGAAAEDDVGIQVSGVWSPNSGDAPTILKVDARAVLAAYLDTLLDLERRMEDRSLIKANHRVHFLVEIDAQGKPVELGCLDCHRNLAHDKARFETNRPQMAGCFVGYCHRKDRNKDNCQRCHFQHLAETAQTTP